MVVSNELSDFEAALRLAISQSTGQSTVASEPVKAAVKARKKFERKVVLGISNNRGLDITEFEFDSKSIMELPAEMEARKAAKAKGLNVYSLISNVRIK
ncbi:hypothetical protein D3C85_1719900 [compost metagenome]